MWLPNDFGRGPGEIAAAFNVSSSGGGHYPQQRNQWVDALARLAPELQDYFKRKRQDEVANMLMNQINPPRAEAVDPSIQGAPATRPFTGGAQGFAAHQMYEKYMKDQQADESDPVMDDLKYQEEYRKAYPEQFASTKPTSEYVDTPQGRMTAHQWATIQDNERKQQARGIGGLTMEQLNQPDYVRYEDASGNKISTEQANADPDNAYARPPGAKDHTPYKQWSSAADLFRRAQGVAKTPEPKVMGKPTDTAVDPAAPVVGSTPQDAGAVKDNVPVLDEARKAIQRGKDPEAVKKRLREMGIDPAGL